MTIADALSAGKEKLQAISDAPRLDAERLLLHILAKKDSSWLYGHGDEEMSLAQLAQFNNLVLERATGKPLAYILGEWEFYGRMFSVTGDVLIPRPTTEQLVDEALTYITQTREKTDSIVIADIGTGSGCIAVSLALELIHAQIYATDISKEALVVARRNAERHGVAKRINFLTGDLLQPIAGIKIDLIVSNPPYVPDAEVAETAAQGKDKQEITGLWFEPRIALAGGEDGLLLVNKLLETKIPLIYETIGGEIKMKNIDIK